MTWSRDYLFFYLGALQVIDFSDSPKIITKNTPSTELDCVLSGWPLPRAVSWYKDDKLITNGTEGMYHSQDIIWKKGEKTLRSILHLPAGREEQEGFYKCSATNRIPGWSSQKDITLQIFYQCKWSLFRLTKIEGNNRINYSFGSLAWPYDLKFNSYSNWERDF